MPEIKRYKVTEPWLKTDCGLGEAPFWDKESNTLRFFDIIKQKMHTVDLNIGPSSHKVFDLPISVGTTANIEGNDDEFVFGGKSGYGIMNKKTAEWRYIKKMWDTEEVQQNKEHRMRSNDGAVDSQGRYFVGTMNDPLIHEPSPEGVLFRLDSDLSLHRIIEPVTIPNGISWTPDGKSVYFTDSPTTEIKKYPYDAATGKIDVSAAKPFFKCPIEGGVPDGHCQDAEGCFWIAMHGTWKVVRLNPDGEIIAEIELPTRCVTCPGIAGQDLYITTAADEEPEKYPESTKLQGATFKVPIGVSGCPLNKFRMTTIA
ncbi:hypothetical protein AAFC00_002138 [Neodothiora populina]|uniref:SMP-30/Gluconolactonase/LRE-like region domain-containing protein n=1 Tax=Neodothiora populina TaxID=2781224 RepID=A0ABR3PGG4_9PEZI